MCTRSMREASANMAVIPAKAGIHNPRVRVARRRLRRSRPDYFCTCVWIPAPRAPSAH